MRGRENKFFKLVLNLKKKFGMKSFCLGISVLLPPGYFCSDADFSFYCLGMFFSQLSSFIVIDLVVSQMVRSSASPLH